MANRPVSPRGKRIFVWKPEHFGTADEIVAALIELGVTAVNLKVANGTLLYTELGGLVGKLQRAGIAVIGWHYLFSGVRFISQTEWVKTGVTPEQEAQVSRDAISLYDLQGFEADVEREFKVYNQIVRGNRYLDRLGDVGIPVGLTSYRFPSLHREFPWAVFLPRVDYVAPQVYWGPEASRGGPVEELNQSYQEYFSLYKSLGITPAADNGWYYPVGRNYYGDGYPVPGEGHENQLAQDIKAFNLEVLYMGFPAVSYWAFDHFKIPTHAVGAGERFQAIQEFNFGTSPTPEPPPVPNPLVTVQVKSGVTNLRLRKTPGTQGGDLTVVGYTYGGRSFQGEKVVAADKSVWYKTTVFVSASPAYVTELE